MNGLTRDGTAEPASRDQILRCKRGKGNKFSPVQLTTSRVGNLIRLTYTLLRVMTINTKYSCICSSAANTSLIQQISDLAEERMSVAVRDFDYWQGFFKECPGLCRLSLKT